MNTVNSPRFDTTMIPETDVRNLCATFTDAVLRFVQNPANSDKVKEWERKYGETKKNKNGGKNV